MSLGELALCKHAQSGNFINLENISIIAICSGNVSVLTEDSYRPKSLRICFRNVCVTIPYRQVFSHSWQWKRDSMTKICTREHRSTTRRNTFFPTECGQADYIEGDTSWENVSSGHIRIAGTQLTLFIAHITKTCLYNFDPLKPHFYIVKLGFTGVCIIFLISAQKHRLWVLVRTASPTIYAFEQKYEKYQLFYLKI